MRVIGIDIGGLYLDHYLFWRNGENNMLGNAKITHWCTTETRL